MNNPAILVADDDPEVLSYLETALLCHKYPVIAAHDGVEVLALLEENRGSVSAAVLDVMMPCKDGIETLYEIRRQYPDLPVIMISGASDPDRIVEAMRAGAHEYLTKPVVHEKLLASIRKVLALQPALLESDKAPESAGSNGHVQVNARMRAISDALRKTAAWNVPVVLRGESGVGKEVLARELHRLSPRASKEFVKINCVALPSELLESELFGYERGAFTGAFKAKPGKFELADGGTILLDEIGDMDLKLQAKLLQVLQDGEFHRLGGKEPVRVDVRVLVATHCDLEKSIEEGTFREDLYYRLNVVSIEVPPLRDRRDEILPLAQHFLEKHSPPDVTAPQLTEELKLAMLAHDWPGNVRELENVVRRYLVFEDAPRLARQLRLGRSARGSPRATDDGQFRKPDPSAAPNTTPSATPNMVSNTAPNTLSHTVSNTIPNTSPNEANGDSSLAHRRAAAAAAGDGGAGRHWENRADVYESGPRNGGARNVPSDEWPQHSQRDHAPERVPPGGDFHDGPRYSERPAPRTFDPAPRAQEQTNLDVLTTRLAHLEGLLGRLVSRAPDEEPTLEPDDEEPFVAQNGQDVLTLPQLDEQRNQAEAEAIVSALEKTEWNRRKAAKLLRADYKALLYRMKKLGIGERNDDSEAE